MHRLTELPECYKWDEESIHRQKDPAPRSFLTIIGIKHSKYVDIYICVLLCNLNWSHIGPGSSVYS